jgi:predicted DNA-binding transcriptional regulator AlpA
MTLTHQIKTHGADALEHALDALPVTVPTPAAALLLGCRPSTLYKWSSCGDGPLKPVKIGSRVRWRVSDIQGLLQAA